MPPILRNSDDKLIFTNTTTLRSSNMPNNAATVNQASPGHPPIMSIGRITMENIAEFTSCAKQYFIYKSVDANSH
ncbi:hypothetical protein C0991_010526, partial [Blastosporella zonata]